MFSKELQELDRNTVQYMIDEMQETIDRQRKDYEELTRREAEHKQELQQQLQQQQKLYEEALARIRELEKRHPVT